MLVSKGFWCLNRIGKVYQCLYAWNFMVIPVIGKAGEMTAWKGNKRESPLLINDNNVPIKMVLYKGICVRVNVCNLYINMSHQQTHLCYATPIVAWGHTSKSQYTWKNSLLSICPNRFLLLRTQKPKRNLKFFLLWNHNLYIRIMI